MSEPARVLAALVATDVVQFKIAVLRPAPGAAATRIFHDKLGILRDAEGNTLIFKGSMNETWSGLAVGRKPRVCRRRLLMARRSRCCSGSSRRRRTSPTCGITTIPASTCARSPRLPGRRSSRRLTPTGRAPWSAFCVNAQRPSRRLTSAPTDVKGRTLKPHQAAGLAAWRANARRGHPGVRDRRR